MTLTAQRTLLADQLERSVHGGAWHGPALAEIVNGLGFALAGWRPYPGFHSIAEVVGHLTFWIEDVHRHLPGAAEPPAAAGSDWASFEPGSEPDWQAALARLEAAHLRLQAALLPLEDAQLDLPVPGSDPTLRGLLLGTLQHIAYHGGQIALLRKLAEQAARGGP